MDGWRWGYRGLLPDAYLAALAEPRRAATWRELLGAPGTEVRVWLAERDGRLVGFAATSPTRDGGQPPLTAELSALYLVEDAAGTGVGRALLERAVLDLEERGRRRALLWVFAANARARRFYERAGFGPDGEERVGRRGDLEQKEVRYACALASTVIPVPEIHTPRLLLRQWRDGDAADLAALNADPRVMEHLPAALTRAESDARLAALRRHFVERGFGLWAVEVPGVAACIGYVGLVYPHLPPPFVPEVEVGWRLAAAHWGEGYATEGARAALAVGFGRLDLERVVSITVPANARSRRVMEKLGMIRAPEDDFDHPSLPEGHRLGRHVLYRLSRADFAARSGHIDGFQSRSTP